MRISDKLEKQLLAYWCADEVRIISKKWSNGTTRPTRGREKAGYYQVDYRIGESWTYGGNLDDLVEILKQER